MALIVDLDQTLIDSRIAEPYRNQRRWADVYELIPQLKPYSLITDLLQLLNDNSIKIAIVTTAPRPYCERIIHYNRWQIDVTVCYHDTRLRKPNPQPLLLAIQKLKVNRSECISAGDRDIDTVASRRAGITSIGCLWGAEDRVSLMHSKPDFLVETVNDFCILSRKQFAIE